MIGLSTSIFSNLPGEEIVTKVVDLGFSQIELNFTLAPKQVTDIIKLAQKQGIYISSLHNFVPEPPESEHGFMLCDIDHDLRRRAVQLTKDTVMLASDLGAKAVVLHMGQPREWDYEELQKELRKAIHEKDNPENIDKLQKRLKQERKNLQGSYLVSMLRSLEELLPLADDLDIRLGVENRYFFGQFPDFEETGILLQEFSGSNLGYWHDCGHAHQIAYCGLGTAIDGLEAFKDLLVGIHLHDTRLWTDHRLPNPDGDIDFSYLKPYIKPETILNLEPARGVNPILFPAVFEHLRSFGIK